jgi:spore maturation protein A
MLNYIWISLIAIGILTAAGNDIRDEVNDTYRNGAIMGFTAETKRSIGGQVQTWECDLLISASALNGFYGTTATVGDFRQPATITLRSGGGASIALALSEISPRVWRDMARVSGNTGTVTGAVTHFTLSPEGAPISVAFKLEPVRFVKLRAITQAAFEVAGTAVNIAIGLIGIMALWLGVMKVAEAAGLLSVLTRLLTPVTRRVFPDVPPDHPAVGAMIMNIAANMLGLSNAATPLGLKAMEELNKLNPKVGTATNAMVTFLAINTGGLVLIPATALAVRASVGSANPGLIIGTSIVGAFCATVAGVAASKLLQRLPRYKRAMEVSNG